MIHFLQGGLAWVPDTREGYVKRRLGAKISKDSKSYWTLLESPLTILETEIIPILSEENPEETSEQEQENTVDDMVRLEELNEPNVLENLKKRYAKDRIYVSI